MDYTFSKGVADLAPSAIREILKFTSTPGVISFAAGNPAPEAFPAEDVARITADIMRECPVEALQYSITEGHPSLREGLTRYMKEKHGVGKNTDALIITSGAQQVMNLTTAALCDPGDVVICECPSFIGSLNAFRAGGVRLAGVPMEEDGMNLNALEDALKTEKRARFIYTIPNFQNPTGITMSLEKRKALYALAKRYGVMILEDNPYGEIRFEGEDVPAIKSLDEDGMVIYAGSFSKVLSPGLRVGYAIAPAPVCAKLIVCKQTQDVHTTILSQMIADRFMRECDFEAHLRRIREIYRHKAGLMMGLMDRFAAPKMTYHRVQGGLFLWCTLPAGVDMPAFCQTAVQNKVALVPGNAFLMEESDPCQSFRVNYSTPTDQQLEQGMEILGELIAKL